MNNLISNAIRYYNPAVSRPYVEISILANSEHAEIIVRDNGIGIDEKYHDKIFDMFFRVSKKSVGSGLGLYIVKETIEKLDGEIGLTSEKDKGTEFKILIPNLN
jgi:signal transduction histidine kinase